ncbi:hypothetical protein AC578_335 [Pseudocercospora eumusae]|uniref:Uncharacterized protein n=1 Tax=Pseudocercospora eumusae TaxID=321146 RepID=A0A139HU06_9PEZI|nr:hypothetical protein AC578_335 [Pseudocercospora eumusae]
MLAILAACYIRPIADPRERDHLLWLEHTLKVKAGDTWKNTAIKRNISLRRQSCGCQTAMPGNSSQEKCGVRLEFCTVYSSRIVLVSRRLFHLYSLERMDRDQKRYVKTILSDLDNASCETRTKASRRDHRHGFRDGTFFIKR